MKFLSICIPCYEMHGRGEHFLNESLKSIVNQKNVDWDEVDVIISDHSQDDKLSKLVDNYRKSAPHITIYYIKNDDQRGSSSANMNRCILASDAEYIKPLFQDDQFNTASSLSNIIEELKEVEPGWMVHTYTHRKVDDTEFINTRTPHYNYKIQTGENSIGPPSCIVFRRDNNFFDTSLLWYMDVDFYYNLYLNYHSPHILNSTKKLQDPYVINTVWYGQVTNTMVTDEVKKFERDYILGRLNVAERKVLELKMHPTAAGDIREHLDTLISYGRECNSIVELGVRSIISTWAFIAASPMYLTSVDICHPDEYQFIPGASKLTDVEKVANDLAVEFKFILSDSKLVEIPECDMLFIDTLHTYDQVKEELRLHAPRVSKYIVFHDVVTFGEVGEASNTEGIGRAIKEFLQENDEWEVKELFTNNNGLLIVQKNEYSYSVQI